MQKKYYSATLEIVTISRNDVIATSNQLAGAPEGLGINNLGTDNLSGAFGNEMD